MTRDDKLQEICRNILRRLKDIADRRNLGRWLSDTIRDNESGRCAATEDEVRMLARVLDEERVRRTDVPRMMGISYRTANDTGLFDKLRKLPKQGIYCKIDVELTKANAKNVP